MSRRGIRLAPSRAAMKKKPARSGDPAKSIARLREQIDETDSTILELLDRRARLASDIGEEKRALQATAKGGGGKSFTFYDPEREQRIFERLSGSRAAGELGFPRG